MTATLRSAAVHGLFHIAIKTSDLEATRAGAGHHRVAEMFIGSQAGLGHSVFEASSCSTYPACMGISAAAGALGYGLNLLFLLAERSFVRWGGK